MSENRESVKQDIAYSVMMLVYFKADPQEFDQAIQSMMEQTLPPDEFVLVCDGPIGEPLEAVIRKYEQLYPQKFNVIRIEMKIGIGPCANRALNECRNEIVVRMDADDISVPNRCELEIAEFLADPELDIVGGYIVEFEGDDEKNGLLREVPLEHDELLKYARRRIPFNNVTVAMRRDRALAVGGFFSLARGEDYEMYCRMLINGAKGKNIPKVLVRCRVNEDAYARRRQWSHTSSLINVRWQLYKRGFSSFIDFLVMSCSHIAIMLLPTGFTKWLYSRHLRKKADGETNQ
ncbi:MAG: glycosyltransferase [Ruminococcaceae bacterium]|nr:glycosyltransferase [Oscillospiraceae bacterium]